MSHVHSSHPGRLPASWLPPLVILGATGFAFIFYVWTAAPGITWAHQGADSGELLAAAMVNGVPHPPGYPLYTMLLQAWLALTGALMPARDLAWRGNLLSALTAAWSVGVTASVAAWLLREQRARWLWALLAALAWAFTPLLWDQAVITEVYALHALAAALLGWALLVKGGARRWVIPVTALGVAHHLTFLLLLPAAAYYLWSISDGSGWSRLRSMVITLALGGIIGALFHMRTPLVAGGGGTPPPINWGYPDNLRGFWWLVSGSAYRGYLFNLKPGDILASVGNWAYTLTHQYTWVGLGISLIGLSYLDAHRPRLRNFGLLWIAFVSLYSVSYSTRDNEIYLLPVAWMMALWLGVGAATSVEWVSGRWPRSWLEPALRGVAVVGVIALLVLHFPEASLRHDQEAEQFLAQVIELVEPNAIIVTNTDATTFAVWYGAWGDGELLNAAPEAIVLNYALYQFDWYRRLQADLHPDVPGVDESVGAVVAANDGKRPVYFTEEIPEFTGRHAYPVGPLWQYDYDQ
jgi:hypothetical protein